MHHIIWSARATPFKPWWVYQSWGPYRNLTKPGMKYGRTIRFMCVTWRNACVLCRNSQQKYGISFVKDNLKSMDTLKALQIDRIYCYCLWSVFCPLLNMLTQECSVLYLDTMKSNNTLTRWGGVMHICISKLTIIGSDNGLLAPSHYLNQCWNIVNSNLRNKLQLKLQQNSYISFRKMHLNVSSVKWQQFCLCSSV